MSAINCNDRIPVCVFEIVEIVCMGTAAVSLAAVKRLQNEQTTEGIVVTAEQLKDSIKAQRNRKIMWLTGTAHTCYYITAIAALILQGVERSKNDQQTLDIIEYLSVAGIGVHTAQLATSIYHYYDRHFSHTLKKDNENLPAALPSNSNDSWSDRLAETAKESVLKTSTIGQAILSSFSILLAYQRKC